MAQIERIQLTVEVRFLRVPTEWTATTLTRGNRTGPGAVPAVSRTVAYKPVELDGWEWRGKFFRLRLGDESAALSFLTEVGIWDAQQDLLSSEGTAGRSLLSGPYGGRYLSGRAAPVLLDDFWREQTRWRTDLLHPAKLKAQFGSPPGSGARPHDQLHFAVSSTYLNALPLRIEWRGQHPIAVIETITGRELLIATTHLDLLRGAKFKVCRRPDCAIPFSVETRHKRKYCSWYCGHIESVRKNRRVPARRI